MLAQIALVQLLLAILLLINNNMISYFICPEGEVAELLSLYLTWVPLGYIGAGFAIVYQSCLNAEGKPLQACSVGIIHRLVLLLPFAIVGGFMSTSTSLFQALMLGHLCAAIYVIYLYRRRRVNSQHKTISIPFLLNKQASDDIGEQV